jgi:c-di-GMP-binding flagellar brake protein YcgR
MAPTIRPEPLFIYFLRGVMTVTQKYYVNTKDLIAIQCLVCKKSQTISVERLRSKNHTLKVKCPCSHSFVVEIEFRKEYRKKVNIAGIYREKTRSPIEAQGCTVTDISLGGLAITINNKTSVELSDELVVSFRLDDTLPNVIDKTINVRHFDRDKKIGGEFIHADDATENEVIDFPLV